MNEIRFVPKVNKQKLIISCCLLRGVKCDNEIQGCVFLKYSCILHDSSTCLKINIAMKKKKIHEGGRYFFCCERALSVLGAIQMDRKVHPLSEKPLNNDEAISQPHI